MQDNIQDYDMTINIEATAIDHKYYIKPIIEINNQLKPKLVRQSYIFFVLQLRTGVNEAALKHIQNCLLESCEEIMNQELKGISFIINGQHHQVKNLNFNAVKQMIINLLTISQSDDYFFTLQKTRHNIQSVAEKLHQTNISLIFLMTYVEIDHSLGVKKRSYIDFLNQHSQKCTDQIGKLAKTISKYTDECKTYIISLDKYGQELQDYSMADTQLMNEINTLVGKYGSIIKRNYTLPQLNESFKEVTALLMTQFYSLMLTLPLQQVTKKDQAYIINLYCSDCKQFKNLQNIFVSKYLLNFDKLLKRQEINVKRLDILQQKLGQINYKINFEIKQISSSQLLQLRLLMYEEQVSQINWKLTNEIVKYKLKFKMNKSYLVMNINQKLLKELKENIDAIYDRSKQLYLQIFQSGKEYNKHTLYYYYSNLKRNIDLVQEVLMGIFKKKLGGSEIGRLSQAISFNSIKNALKNKLIRRINGNPYLLDQVYKSVKQIVDGGTIDYLSLETNSQNLRHNLGNCIISDYNFVKAMKQYDALGVAFQIQRPQSAIADPGRIRIRQVSPFLMRTSKFFQKFMYKINFIPQMTSTIFQYYQQCNSYHHCICPTFQISGRCKYYNIQMMQISKYQKDIQKVDTMQWNHNASENTLTIKFQKEYFFDGREIQSTDYLRDVGELQKFNYSERCDYGDRVQSKQTTLGFIPLYLTKEHWRVAKHLMKPCMGWTATGEPLGYLFSQYQTIPFMLLSSLIKICKQKAYSIKEQQKNVDKCSSQKQLNLLQSKLNFMKKKLTRMTCILEAVEETCLNIMRQLSTQKYQQKLIERVYNHYRNYTQPINRTVDVISNNSCFIAQIYCLFKYELVPRPKEEEFHHFFIRLVEEELRRQTDGWNEEDTQDLFIDKLLNVSAGDIKNTNFNIIGGEQYYNNFMEALNGNRLQASYVQLQKQELQMMLKKQGKFNDNQRMLMIEYKRLYQNRVLWFWYIRFKLYTEVQRILIHKWKCLSLVNSYMLFTMIIQNKKQRKNHKRRQAILDENYSDPFDYKQAQKYLEREFVMLRSKKEAEVLKHINNKMYTRAASIFVQTQCLEQAAGTLLNMKVAVSIRNFYEELLNGKTIMLSQKLKMILVGQYRGVYLFSGWKMSKKRFTNLRKVYPVEFMKYQYMF